MFTTCILFLSLVIYVFPFHIKALLLFKAIILFHFNLCCLYSASGVVRTLFNYSITSIYL